MWLLAASLRLTPQHASILLVSKIAAYASGVVELRLAAEAEPKQSVPQTAMLLTPGAAIEVQHRQKPASAAWQSTGG